MKSILALVLVAVAGSAALVASAQTQDNASNDQQRIRSFSSPSATASTTATSATQAEPAGVTVDVSPLGTTVRRSPEVPAQSYTTGTISTRRTAYLQEIVVEDSDIAHQADQLARQLAESKSHSDRDNLKVKLTEVLAKQFEQRQKRHEGEIAELEAQVKKLKDLVARRQENRREIIARRLEQVLRESQGLGW